MGLFNRRALNTISLVLLALVLTAGCSREADREPPVIKKGKLDLSDWQFGDDSVVKLDGDWEFYWRRLLSGPNFHFKPRPKPDGYFSVPGTWNSWTKNGTPGDEGLGPDGFATFRLKLRLPHAGATWALRLFTMATAVRVYINGVRVGEVGAVSEDKADALPEYRPVIMRFTPESRDVEVTMQVSNFFHRQGGPWDSIVLGPETVIQEQRDKDLAIDLFMAGVLIIMGLYHIGLFVVRKKDHSPLAFAFVCLFIALYTLANGEIYIEHLFPNLSWNNIVRMDYFAGFLGTASLCHFVYTLFPEFFPKKFLGFVWLVGGGFSVTTMVTEPRIFSNLMPIFEIVLLVVLIVTVYTFIRSALRGLQGARFFLLGFLVLAITVVNDILTAEGIIKSSYIIPFGFFFFIFSQATILSNRFSRAFFQVEKLSENLLAANKANSKFVPTEFLNLLGKQNITEVRLGDRVEKEMTVLFADIRDFTSFSESLNVTDNFNFINAYLNRMGPIIRNNRGFIDKYIGDAIMALFPDSPDDAIAAALQMQKELDVYNSHRSNSGYRPIQVGAGIHTGRLMLGTVGESERMEGTVISDAVNLASRLEGLTKIYGCSIVISGQTLDRIRDREKLQYRIIDTLRVKGKKKNVTVYQVYPSISDEEYQKKIEMDGVYARGLEHFSQRRYEEAMECFQKVLEHDPDDRAPLVLMSRCRLALKGGQVHEELESMGDVE